MRPCSALQVRATFKATVNGKETCNKGVALKSCIAAKKAAVNVSLEQCTTQSVKSTKLIRQKNKQPYDQLRTQQKNKKNKQRNQGITSIKKKDQKGTN